MTQASKQKQREIGTMVLGRYRVVRALAQGGMGTVYLARAEGAAGFVKPVVIKRSLQKASRLTDELFAREARILSNLRHPGIVGIVDFAEEDGDYVMVLDYVHGFTLSQWSRFVRKTRGKLPVELAVYAVSEMLTALEYAHTLRDSKGSLLGIVHRDIKPSNVLIDIQGLVKLADFGVARTNTEITDTSTGGSTLKGTFAYMAPELFSGADPSPATDVYSAALTLYQLLAGRNPFTTNDAALTAARALRHEPPSLDGVRSDVSRGLSSAIAKGMCKHPEGRFASAGELATALRASCPEADDIAGRFQTAIERDFTDPALPNLLDIDSLSERETAWTRFGDDGDVERTLALPLSPSQLEHDALVRPTGGKDDDADTALVVDDDDEPTAETRAAEHVHEAPTVLFEELTPNVEDAPDGQRPRRRSVIPLVLAVAGVGVGAAALLATRGGDDRSDQPVVMVRGDVSMETEEPVTPDPPEQPVAVDQPTDATTDRAPATVAKPQAPKKSTAAELTARFRKQQRGIAGCFAKHGPADHELAVRFRVDRRGAVIAAELIPAAEMTTPRGRCLLAVARRSQFGPQPEPIAFRIPLQVREQ